MRSWQFAAAGVLFTLIAGFVARRLIMAQYSFGGRFFAVAVWVIIAGAAASAVVAFAASRRPYVLGLGTGVLAIMLTGVALFWPQASIFWVLTALVVAVFAGAIGAFMGITVRWLLGGGAGGGRLPT